MTAKIVCRVLDANGRMLGWSEHHALVPGDGTLRADGPVQIPIDQRGRPYAISLHWVDVNVETRIPCSGELLDVHSGSALTVFASGQPIVTLGQPPVGLPMITVGRPVRVGIPVGQMGSRG